MNIVLYKYLISLNTAKKLLILQYIIYWQRNWNPDKLNVFDWAKKVADAGLKLQSCDLQISNSSDTTDSLNIYIYCTVIKHIVAGFKNLQSYLVIPSYSLPNLGIKTVIAISIFFPKKLTCTPIKKMFAKFFFIES